MRFKPLFMSGYIRFLASHSALKRESSRGPPRVGIRATIQPAMKRPIGVRVIAALQSVGAARLFVEAVDSLVEVSKGQRVEAAPILRAILRLIVALIPLVVAIGLWNLRPWARYMTLIGCTLLLLLSLIGLGAYLFRQDAAAFIGALVEVSLSGLILWYLFRARVKAAFHATRPSAEAPQLRQDR